MALNPAYQKGESMEADEDGLCRRRLSSEVASSLSNALLLQKSLAELLNTEEDSMFKVFKSSIDTKLASAESWSHCLKR